MLKFFEVEARFPSDASELPPAAVGYVAEQVKVGAAELADYRWRARRLSITAPRSGMRSASATSPAQTRTSWRSGLRRRCARSSCATSSCVRRCWCDAAPKGSNRQDVSRGSSGRRAGFEQQFCDRIVTRLGEHCAERLEHLASRQLLAELTADPGQVRLETLLKEAEGDRQAQRDPQPATAGGPVRRRVGEADRGLAGASRPLLPVGSASSGGAGAVDAAGSVVPGLVGRDRRLPGRSADRPGAQDQHLRGSAR